MFYRNSSLPKLARFYRDMQCTSRSWANWIKLDFRESYTTIRPLTSSRRRRVIRMTSLSRAGRLRGPRIPPSAGGRASPNATHVEKRAMRWYSSCEPVRPNAPRWRWQNKISATYNAVWHRRKIISRQLPTEREWPKSFVHNTPAIALSFVARQCAKLDDRYNYHNVTEGLMHGHKCHINNIVRRLKKHGKAYSLSTSYVVGKDVTVVQSCTRLCDIFICAKGFCRATLDPDLHWSSVHRTSSSIEVQRTLLQLHWSGLPGTRCLTASS